MRAADERQEEREVLARVSRPASRTPDPGEELLDRGVAARDAEGRRLADRQRREHRPARRREQRDDAAVRVPDEVVAVAQLGRNVVGLLLEVDPLERRAGRVAAPREEDALEPVLQRRCSAHVDSALPTLPWTNTIRERHK